MIAFRVYSPHRIGDQQISFFVAEFYRGDDVARLFAVPTAPEAYQEVWEELGVKGAVKDLRVEWCRVYYWSEWFGKNSAWEDQWYPTGRVTATVEGEVPSAAGSGASSTSRAGAATRANGRRRPTGYRSGRALGRGSGACSGSRTAGAWCCAGGPERQAGR